MKICRGGSQIRCSLAARSGVSAVKVMLQWESILQYHRPALQGGPRNLNRYVGLFLALFCWPRWGSYVVVMIIVAVALRASSLDKTTKDLNEIWWKILARTKKDLFLLEFGEACSCADCFVMFQGPVLFEDDKDSRSCAHESSLTFLFPTAYCVNIFCKLFITLTR